MRILVSFLFIATLLMISSTVLADAVIQTSFSTTPATLKPGNDGYITVNLKNTGSNDATSVKVSIATVDSGIVIDEYRFLEIGGVGASETANVLFKFSVPRTTPSGQYRVKFSISYCTGGSCRDITQFAMITVSSPSLLEVASLEPNRINVGEQTEILLTLSNNGNDNIENAILTWEEPNNNILPIGSGNRIIISAISAKNSAQVPLKVVTNPNMVAGVYHLVFALEFSDKAGNTQKSNSTIGLIVGGTTDFDVSFQEFSSGTFSLSVANIGLNPAKSVTIKIPNQEEMTTAGSKSAFLGDLDPGDFTIASFDLIPKDLTQAKINLLVDVSYTDNSGIRQAETQNVSINLQEHELKTYHSSEKVDVRVVALIVVAALAALFVFWKYIKRYVAIGFE
jgi:hypothetical protein